MMMPSCHLLRIPDAIPIALLEEMFDQYPDSPFFIKDADLRYVAVNHAMVRFCGASRKSDLLGQRVSAFFPDEFRKYEDLDRQVLATGEPVIFRLDQSIIAGRPLVWLLFHRYPLRDEQGHVTGIIAMSRQLEHPGANNSTYNHLVQVVHHITEHSASPLNLTALARLAGVSVSQLNRVFRKVFRMTPRDLHLKIRFKKAMAMVETNRSIAEIAHACGYADQSAFTRRFRDMTGLTPSQYRQSLSNKRTGD